MKIPAQLTFDISKLQLILYSLLPRNGKLEIVTQRVYSFHLLMSNWDKTEESYVCLELP